MSAFANWRLVMGPLAEHTRVLAPDLAGFGYSEIPAGLAFSREVWLRQIVDFLDAVGVDRVSVVGNSFGGSMALALAIHHPERVDKLILMGSVGVHFDITDGLDAVWGYEPSAETMGPVSYTHLGVYKRQAEALGASRTTVTRAYDLLRERGFLASRRGSGSVAMLPVPGGASPSAGILRPSEEGDDEGIIDLTCAALRAPVGIEDAYQTALEVLPRYLAGAGYTTVGLPELRAALAEQYAARGLATNPDQILITSGAVTATLLAVRSLVCLLYTSRVGRPQPAHRGDDGVGDVADGRRQAEASELVGVLLGILRGVVGQEPHRYARRAQASDRLLDPREQLVAEVDGAVEVEDVRGEEAIRTHPHPLSLIHI